jgi:hypothetical protein
MLLNLSAFDATRMVTNSPDVVVNISGSRGGRGDAPALGTASVSLQDPPIQAEVSHVPEASALNITLSRCVGVVNHSNTYSALTGCLQDVHFTAPAFHTFVFVVLVLTHFCLVGCFFDQSC